METSALKSCEKLRKAAKSCEKLRKAETRAAEIENREITKRDAKWEDGPRRLGH